jgi:hypothetical protein
MITATQCIAGREFLGWSQGDLAKEAGVGTSAVRRVEADTRVRSSISETGRRIVVALQRGGVIFFAEQEGCPYVMLRPGDV